MPRKAAAAAVPATAEGTTADSNPPAVPDAAEASTGARRSSRLSSKAVAAPPPPAPKPKRAAGKKRPAADAMDVDEPADEASGEAEKGATAEDAPAAATEEGGVKKRARKATAKKDKDTAAEGDEAEASPAPSLSPIELGDPLPSLVLKNEKDEDIQIADLVDETNGVVLFLVPKADTPGCTNQACAFRDSYPDFTGVNYNVYCVSADTAAAQAKWQTKNTLPYPLISDRQRVLIAALGASDAGKTKRSHFIFGPKGADGQGGRLLEKKIPVKPADSPRLALEFIKSQSA